MQKPLVIGIVLLGLVLVYFNVNHYAFLKAELQEDLQELAEISVNEVMENVMGNFVSFRSVSQTSSSRKEVVMTSDSSAFELEMITPFLDSIEHPGIDSSFYEVIAMLDSAEVDGSTEIRIMIEASDFSDDDILGDSLVTGTTTHFIDADQIRQQFDSIYSAKINQKIQGVSYYYITDTIPPSGVVSEVKFESLGLDNEALGFNGYKNQVLLSLMPTIVISLLLFGVLIFAYFQNAKVLREQKALAEAKDDFMANITHELKTPISAVKVAMEAMMDFGVSEQPLKVNQYAKESHHQLNKLEGLINRVLEFSNSNSKNLLLAKEELKPAVLIRESMALFKSAMDEKQLALEIISKGDVTLSADRLHLTGVINNLIDNAVKYTPEHQSVKVHLEEENESVTLKVTNSGVSLSEEELSRLFDKFYRVPQHDVHDVKGHGLGLYYVKTVVEAHGGTVTAGSAENVVELSVSLPQS